MDSSSQVSNNVSTQQDSVPQVQEDHMKKSKIDSNLDGSALKAHTTNIMCTNKVSEGISHWLNIDKKVDSEGAIARARIVDPKSIKKEGWLTGGISSWASSDKETENRKITDQSRIEDVQKIKTRKQVKDGVSLWQNYDKYSDLEKALEKARLVDPKKIKTERRVSDSVSHWKSFATNHQYKQTLNPFFDWEGAEIEARRINPTYQEDEYGWPVEGSLTWMRGQKAGKHIAGEIIELCKVIADRGDKQENGTYKITFGKLFKTYVYISDKVVGMLWRARRHMLLDYPREMLYQGQDDDVVITLFRVPDDGEKLKLKYWRKNDDNNNQ